MDCLERFSRVYSEIKAIKLTVWRYLTEFTVTKDQLQGWLGQLLQFEVACTFFNAFSRGTIEINDLYPVKNFCLKMPCNGDDKNDDEKSYHKFAHLYFSVFPHISYPANKRIGIGIRKYSNNLYNHFHNLCIQSLSSSQ